MTGGYLVRDGRRPLILISFLTSQLPVPETQRILEIYQLPEEVVKVSVMIQKGVESLPVARLPVQPKSTP